jgi:hypothetical protein
MNFTTTRRLSFGVGLISLLSGSPLLADEELSLSFLDKNDFYLSSAGFKVNWRTDPRERRHCTPCRRIVS